MISNFNYCGILATIILGAMAVISPCSAARMVGIDFSEPRGKSEVRATYGGLFLGLGVFALVSQEPAAFRALGFGWLGAATVRIFSIIFDRAFGKLNIGGVLLEVIIGALLIL